MSVPPGSTAGPTRGERVPGSPEVPHYDRLMTWLSRILAVPGLVVVAWVLVTALPAVLHGHPAYAVLIGLTVLGCAWTLWVHRARRPGLHGWRRVGSITLSLGVFASVSADYPEATGWVLAGHSLGGTVAAIQANDNDQDAASPVRGLMFHASFPGSDLSDSLTAEVRSVFGTRDGLATPADIEASRVNLTVDAQFEAIDGAVHAFFGDYSPQPGDGQPGISHDEARTLISQTSVDSVARVAGDR